ncbi:MAG TPA: cation transporter [Candidatus Onthousia faecipullorum]|uniref:Cation transporter n=1 Tax=Candidatus Onthousia faecipullorum TaxID=2840887 RepID=A0A9D1GBT0_9FIRM|nr:cation transporter [Candidatus Onthousia faecipullorum]
MKDYKFKIEGLDCANCANELEESLRKIDLIENVSISFMMERLNFSCSEDNLNNALKQIKKTIKREEPDVTIEEV